jgi:hypothetical protein
MGIILLGFHDEVEILLLEKILNCATMRVIVEITGLNMKLIILWDQYNIEIITKEAIFLCSLNGMKEID